MAQQDHPQNGPQNSPQNNGGSDPTNRPRRVEDGPPQIDESPQGASADREIAQEPQQSTGLGMGQS